MTAPAMHKHDQPFSSSGKQTVAKRFGVAGSPAWS